MDKKDLTLKFTDMVASEAFQYFLGRIAERIGMKRDSIATTAPDPTAPDAVARWGRAIAHMQGEAAGMAAAYKLPEQIIAEISKATTAQADKRTGAETLQPAPHSRVR